MADLWGFARLVLVGLSVLLASCGDLTTPATLTNADASLDSPLGGSTVVEEFALHLAFEDPGRRTLAPQVTIDGARLDLIAEQSYDVDTGRLSLAVRLRNRGTEVIWRPLRIELLDRRPASLGVLQTDDVSVEAGVEADAIWDLGQQVDLMGGLAPGVETSPRVLEFSARSRDQAGLQGVLLTFRVTGQVAPAFPPTPYRDPTDAEVEEGFVAGRLLVRYRAGELDSLTISRLNVRHDLAGHAYDPLLNLYLVFPADPSFASTEFTRNRLAADPIVEFVSLDRVSSILAAPLPSETELGREDAVGLFPHAWAFDHAAGRAPGAGVTVAILDTGLGVPQSGSVCAWDPTCSPGSMVTHSEFQGRVVEALDARRLTADSGNLAIQYDPSDRHGHGTAVTSVLAASADGEGVVGGAYGVRILSIRTHDARGFGTSSSTLRGLKMLANRAERGEVQLANLSWGVFLEDSIRYVAETEGGNHLIDRIAEHALVIAATGNCDAPVVAWPARHPRVVAVGGTNTAGTERWVTRTSSERCDDLARQLGLPLGSLNGGSSYGRDGQRDLVDFVAPSEAVSVLAYTPAFGHVIGTRREEFQGTSFAAPQVAAVAAVIKARRPELSADELRAELGRYIRVVLDPASHTIVPSVQVGRGRIVADLEPRPMAVILSPAGGSVYQWGTRITFEGRGVASDGRVLTDDELVWTSDRDGALGTGAVLSGVLLSPGNHEVTLTGVSDGHSATASVQVAIEHDARAVSPPAVWSWPSNARIEGVSAGPNGLVYVLTREFAGGLPRLHALRQSDGVKVWEQSGWGVNRTQPVVGADGTVYVGGSDGLFGGSGAGMDEFIAAFDGTTGDLHWVVPGIEHAVSGGYFTQLLVGPGGTLVAPTTEDVRVYDASTGAFLWSGAQTAWPGYQQDGVVRGDRAYLLTQSDITEIDLAGQRVVERLKLPMTGSLTLSAGASGTVYVGSWALGAGETQIVAVDPAPLRITWQHRLPYNGHTVTLASGDVLVAGWPHLKRIDPDAALVWSYPDTLDSTSPVAAVDGTVLVSNNNGGTAELRAHDGATGQLLWRLPVPRGVLNMPDLLLLEGGLLLAHNGTTLDAYQTVHGGPALSSWPMRFYNPQRTGRVR